MNKKKIGLVFLVLSLLLIIFGLIKINLPSKNGNDSKSINKLTEEQIIELINNIPYEDNSLYYLFSEKTVLDSVPKTLLAETALNSFDKKDMNGTMNPFISQNDCTREGGIYANENCYVYDNFRTNAYFFDKEKLVEKVNKMYGIDISSEEINELYYGNMLKCRLVDGKYYCKEEYIDFGEKYSQSIVGYKDYKVDGNNIYIYVTHLYLVNEGSTEAGDAIIKVYDKKKGNYLGDTYTFDPKVILPEYGDKASIYKSTYVKDDNNNIIWKSIETSE